MARKPRDFDAELQALMERAKKLKGQKTVQLGELVQVTGADTLPVEALAGALLAAVEQSKKQPEAVARWTERGAAFFRDGAKRGGKGKAGPGGTPNGAGETGSGTPAAGGGT
ncbi:conjugal transfer protein TraD [Roseomonas sp. NAR14]|uniref:Conjugal transfer protein TraD n=1 Tax=Roseomonas acroporae TaxID=2937791 RepID=A0A9X1YDQ1_9PROT|nr:conjugal transfer protein TraD [Roseomonas acroporae]MCK8787870.1 conjugal transfer protein TraD [Roseomonas acroporae]